METTYTDAQLRRLLLETLEKTPRLRRKALLERCVAQLDFSQTQLSDRTAGSPVIRCKSRLGALLSELIRSGDIAESESGYLSVLQAADAVAQRERAAAFLLGELRQGAALPRRELFARARSGYDHGEHGENPVDFHLVLRRGAAACLTGRAGRETDVLLRRGALHIRWADDGHVMMTGPAAESFRGTVSLRERNPA